MLLDRQNGKQFTKTSVLKKKAKNQRILSKLDLYVEDQSTFRDHSNKYGLIDKIENGSRKQQF